MPSGNGKLGFERDIKPLFRTKDRDAMLQAFDLFDYDDVVDNADDIVGSRPTLAPMRSDCPTTSSTSPPTPPGPSPNCITATFARTPDVKYVFSHAGGTVPFLAGRFAIIDEMDVIPGAGARATAAETFRHLYWDTAASWGDPVLRMLRDVVGLDHVVFGTDYPYLPHDLAVSCRADIEASPELTENERTAILGATATKLIPRLAALRQQARTHTS
jgi:hypothetical protein